MPLVLARYNAGPYRFRSVRLDQVAQDEARHEPADAVQEFSGAAALAAV
jgi:hypothetical protein